MPEVLDLATQVPDLYRYPLKLDLEIIFFSITSLKIRFGSDLEDLQNTFRRSVVVLLQQHSLLAFCRLFLIWIAPTKIPNSFRHGEEREKVDLAWRRRGKVALGCGNLNSFSTQFELGAGSYL